MKSILRALLLTCLAWLPLAYAADTPVAGRDYVEIDAGRWNTPAGKVEVAEVFGYTCPHCAHFEPYLRQWQKKQAADVNLVTIPAAFGGQWDAWARVYLATEKLGVLKRTHQALFDALHVQGSLPRNASPQELATFLAPYGVDTGQFLAALVDPATEAKMQRTAQYIRSAGLTGTPSVLVNGRWRVQANSFEDTLRITDWLVARERAAAKTPPTSR